MKRSICIFLFTALVLFTNAQTPQKISYQCVVRNSNNELVTDQTVGLQISILQGSVGGTAVMVERHTPVTNSNGLITIEIGSGSPVSGTLDAISWAAGPYFIKTQADPEGGSNYTITGISQILSVPYALHAKKADSAIETDPLFSVHPVSGITSGSISNWNIAYGWGDHSKAGYTPGKRSLSINGKALDLTADRVWDVGTVTSVGLTLPDIFMVTGTPVTKNGTINVTLASQLQTLVFAAPSRSAGPPVFRALVGADIPDLHWSKITDGKPVTLAGYGITDGMNTSHPANIITSDNLTNWNTAFGWGNHAAAGYVPAVRTLTVNGTSHDLSVNRTWNVGTVTSITTGNGITGGPVTSSGTIGLTGQALALHNLGTAGLITRTGSSTVTARTINAGTGIVIKNGDGVVGNPEISARTYNTGEYAHGGVIFWVDETRQHGLVCAITDQDDDRNWGETAYTYARGNHLYSGKMNTALIIAKSAALNAGYNAARLCMEYYNPEGTTYGDWFLPAREELYVMYRNKETIDAIAVANGGTAFSPGIYWSSTEGSNAYAWGIDFYEGTEETYVKSLECHVRAVRAF